MKLSSVTAVIPCYEPSKLFEEYIDELMKLGLENIVVVDDGNSSEYQQILLRLKEKRIVVIQHGINLGKGRAFKSAFNYILVNRPETEVIVTCDCHGTYLAKDVVKVAMEALDHTIVLGTRDFSSELIDEKNRNANKITYYLLKLLAGITMNDTQTGLRAFKRDLLPYLLKVSGESYDYDFNMIFEKKEIMLYEVKIDSTVRESDKKTHFVPLKDSWVVIKTFLIFILTSLSSTILDLVLYSFFIGLLIDVLPVLYITVATFAARVISDVYNYNLDKYLVFKAEETSHFSRYVMLAVIKTIASALFVTIFVLLLGDGETWIKLVVDTAIFFVGYRFEKSWVYAK